MNKRLFVIAAVAALAGCDGSPPHDVPYYKAHDGERAAKIAQCDNDPGHLDLSPNCKNAHAAQSQKVFDPQTRISRISRRRTV